MTDENGTPEDATVRRLHPSTGWVGTTKIAEVEMADEAAQRVAVIGMLGGMLTRRTGVAQTFPPSVEELVILTQYVLDGDADAAVESCLYLNTSYGGDPEGGDPE